MELTSREKTLYGKDASIVRRAEDHTVYRLGDTDGEALLTVYPVFPGIEIIYHDIHAHRAEVCPGGKTGLMEINHCREGRIEYRYGENFYFLSPGDMSVSLKDDVSGAAGFPTGHYHGITVSVDPTLAPECLSCFLQDVEVRPSVLVKKFCSDSSYFSARSSSSVEHVFSELYRVPEDIRTGYFKVKVLELFLFLSALPADMNRRSYTRSQINLARTIGEYLREHTEDKITIAELSEMFGASPSMITQSFRGMYGVPPAAFLRSQKMRKAAELLRDTDRTILDIAGQFGYDNASKFAKAFRDVIGVAPMSYRIGILQDSCAPADESGRGA